MCVNGVDAGLQGRRSCARAEAKRVDWYYNGLTADDLALLGTLGSVLPALETLHLLERSGAAPTACSDWRRGWARARCRP